MNIRQQLIQSTFKSSFRPTGHLPTQNGLLWFKKHSQSQFAVQISLDQELIRQQRAIAQASLEFIEKQGFFRDIVSKQFKKTTAKKPVQLTKITPPHLSHKQPTRNIIQKQKESFKAQQEQSLCQNSVQFSKLVQKDVERFSEIVGAANIILDQEEIKPFNIDFTKKYQGQTKLVLTPTSTEQIQEILKYCNEKRLPIVPQGGNTGLVGGSVPVQDEIVLNIKKLNNIIDFDPMSGILTCQSGCILETLQQHVKQFGYLMPLDLGAKGSCMIGGNISTNAGGIKFIKYGSMHANTVGLKAVIPDGTVLDSMKTQRKDSTGFDINHLFIGAEGTLGIVTECQILCHPMPSTRQVCLLASDDYNKVLKCLSQAKRDLSDTLSAIEFMDYESLAFSMNYFNIENPFRDQKYKYYLLIEAQSNASEAQVNEQVLEMLEHMQEEYEDAIVCDSELQKDTIWKIREGISMATAHNGFTIKFDVSVQSKDFADLIDQTQDICGDRAIMIGHGHIGDGNLHLNCTIKGFDDKILLKELQQQLEPFVFKYIHEKKGSISAEHGIGQQKAEYLKYSKSKEMIEQMKMIKGLFDPNGIMNPYKVLPK
eukprot:403369172